MVTTNIAIVEVDPNQDQKVVTINEALNDIDDAFGDALTVLVDNTNAASITVAQLRGNQFFVLTDGAPVPTAVITITVDSGVSRGTVTFVNTTSFDATVEITSQPVTAPIVAAGTTKILTVDTTNVREPQAGASLTVQKDDANVTTDTATINFEGSGVSVVDEGAGKATVTVSGGTGGSASVISQEARGALVRSGSNQSAATSTLTPVAFDLEEFDTDAIHDNATNNTRLTVPSGVTKVRLKGNMAMAGSAGGNERTIRITKNGSTFNGSPQETNPPSTANGNIGVTTTVLDVVAGDFFELEAFQDSGGALNILFGNFTWFSMEIVETIDTANLQSVAVGTRPRFRGALVELTTTEAVATSENLAWDQAIYDTDNFFSGGSPTRLTVPAGVTKVRVKGAVTWDSSAFDHVARIDKNGVTGTESFSPRGDNGDIRAGQSIQTPVIPVVAGDFFELFVSTSTASNVIVAHTYFSIEVVEETGATDFPTGFIAVQPVQKGALVRIDADKAAQTTIGPTDWDSATYDTAFDPGDGGLPQRFWLGLDLVVTFTNATDTVNATAHGMVTGEGPVEITNSGGAVPTGLAVATKYWWISTGTNTGQFATSRVNAIAGTPVTFSDDGTGTTTMERADRLIIPASINKVRIGMQAFTTATVGRILMELEKEGSVNFPGNPAQLVETADTNERINMVSATLEVVEGDVFKVLNFVSAAVNLEGNDGRTWASIEVVEEARALSFPGVTVERPQIGCRITLSVNQAGQADSVNNPVPFDQEEYDTGYRGTQFHDTVTNNTRIIVPAGVRKIRLSGGTGITITNLPTQVDVRILKNGSLLAPDVVSRHSAAAAGGQFGTVETGTLEVVAGDFFELAELHIGGTSTKTIAAAQSWFAMEVVETEEAAFPPEQMETKLIADGTALVINSIEHKKVASRRFSLNDEFSGSAAHAVTAPTVTAQVFDVKRNGTIIGTITFAVASQTATFATTGAGQEDFAVGDQLTIETQGTVNIVIRDVVINLFAFRT